MGLRISGILGVFRSLFTALAFLLGTGFPLGSLLAGEAGDGKVPVLLSFDIEMPGDFERLEEIDLPFPATYFVLGSYAFENQEKVKTFFKPEDTIGGHSYSHYVSTDTPEATLRDDFWAGKYWLEQLTGRKIVWFRVPYLVTNGKVSRLARDVGYKYSSSLVERWENKLEAYSLPISSGPEGTEAVDFFWFNKRGWNEEKTLSWLIEAFEKRKITKRPFVILLHPNVIYNHMEMFRKFIDYANNNGGEFLSFDAYKAELEKKTVFEQKALIVDIHSPDFKEGELFQNIKTFGFTDIYILAKRPDGSTVFNASEQIPDPNNYLAGLVQRLNGTGIRAHAVLHIGRDKAFAARKPELALVDMVGKPSQAWIDYSGKEYMATIVNLGVRLIDDLGMAGIVFDSLGMPALKYGYNQNIVDQFGRENEIGEIDDNFSLLAKYLEPWTDWRMGRTRDFVIEFRQRLEAALENNPGMAKFTISAFLDAKVGWSHNIAGGKAQSLTALAEILNYIVLRPPAEVEGGGPLDDFYDRLLFSAKVRVGITPVMLELPYYFEKGGAGSGGNGRLLALCPSSQKVNGLVALDLVGLPELLENLEQGCPGDSSGK